MDLERESVEFRRSSLAEMTQARNGKNVDDAKRGHKTINAERRRVGTNNTNRGTLQEN